MNSRNRSYKNVLYVNFYIVSDILSYILVHIASLCIKYLQKNSFSHVDASLFIIFQIQWVLTKKILSSSFLEPDWASIHLLKPNFIIKIQEKLIFKIELTHWSDLSLYIYRFFFNHKERYVIVETELNSGMIKTSWLGVFVGSLYI